MLIAPLPGTATPGVFILNRPRTVIGRDAGCDLIIDDVRVSRRHAVISRRGDTYMLDDQQSRNGTRVNGVAVVRRRLHPGDCLSLGGLVFAFEKGEPPSYAVVVAAAAAPVHRGDTNPARDSHRDRTAAISMQAWQIVRSCPMTGGAALRPWLEEVVASLAGAVGIGHVLMFLPAGVCAPGETFIRRGKRQGRAYNERILRDAAFNNRTVGFAAGRRVSGRQLGKGRDAIYIPIPLPDGRAGCCYFDSADGLPAELLPVLLSVADALAICFRLLAEHRPDGQPVAWQPQTLQEIEDRHIRAMYDHCRQNQSESARRLGISRSKLRAWLNKANSRPAATA